MPLVTRFREERLEPDGSINLYWMEGIRVRGKIVDDGSGNPLAGIAIYTFSRSHQQPTTAADGSFQIWFPSEESINYYPADATGRYTTADPFYQYPEKLPVDGVLDLAPTRMLTTSTATGTVVDREGQPVADARIECQYQIERFTDTVILFSDTDGHFQFAASRSTARLPSARRPIR